MDKFNNGGQLFEPTTLKMSNDVMIESRETISEGNLFFLGMTKAGHTDFKYISNGFKVSFDEPWVEPSSSSSNRCVFESNGEALNWVNDICDMPAYSICESVPKPESMNFCILYT